jgi:hypothetical protein
MTRHDRIEEMMAAQALGGLSAADEAELELLRAEHGRDCEECGTLQSAYGEVAGRLAFAADPLPVRGEMADEILARAADRDEEAARPALAGAGAAWVRRLAVAATAALLLVAGGLGGYLFGNQTQPTSETAALAAILSHDDARVAAFTGSGTGNLSVAFRPGHGVGFVFGSGLAPPPQGRVYELWTFGPGGKPAPSGTFTGGGPVVVRVATDLSRARLMAVTVERAPGSKQPTTKPIFTAPVTT